MTKHKKDTLALFEVLRDGKEKGKSGSVLETPKWWRRGPAVPQTPVPATTAGGLTIGAAASQATASRQGVWFRLTSLHLVVAVVAMALIVAAAFWIGRGKREPVLSRSTEVIKKDPADPAVLDAGHDAAAGNAEQDPALLAGQGRTPPAEAGGATPPRGASQDTARVAGRNYIIVQSYPEIATANEAREHLAKSGIPCTVEKGLSFAPKWYCVVTLAGFEKTSSREYEECVRKIQSASKRFVSPKFKQFEPRGYMWR